MSTDKNSFMHRFFEDIDLESVLKQNRCELMEKKKHYSFNDHHQMIFNTIEHQIFNDYCFINNLSEQNLPKEILERIHQRAIAVFKADYPDIQLPDHILNYNFSSYDDILNDVTDEKKFKSTYFQIDEEHTCFKFLLFDPKYNIDQTNYFAIVVSELSVNGQKRKLQLAYDLNTGVCVGTPEMANRLYFEKGIEVAYALNPTRKVANLGMHPDGTWSGWANNTFRHFNLGDKITEDKPAIIQTTQQSKIAAIRFVQNALSQQKQ